MASLLNGTVTPHRSAFDPPPPALLGPDGKPLRGRDLDERAIGLALPHAMTFIARQTGGFGTYWHDRFDECLRFNRAYADTMRNDGWLSALLQERMLAVYALRHSWHLEIPNEKDRFQVRVRDAVTAILRGIVPLGRIMLSSLDAMWFGKQGIQFQWGWIKSPDPEKKKALSVLDWIPIQGDKIGHQFLDPDTGHYVEQPYILVDAAYANQLERKGAKIIVTTLGQALVLQGNWRERFQIHRHLVEDSDWFYSDRAEAIHGIGIRSKIFWANWLKWEWLANITDFFDRVGLGITVWRYPQGNDAALQAIKQAANDQSQRAHIFVPVAEGTEKHQAGIERIEVSTTGSSFLREMIEYIDKIIERYVVGQEASSKSSSQGMGNEASSDFQRDTKRNITLFDADMLAETLTGSAREPGLVNTILKYSYPEADFPLVWRFDQESGESEKKLTSIKTVVDMGVKVKADEARKAAGLSKPIDGDEVIQPPQMPGMPAGTPPGAASAQSDIAQPGEGGVTQSGGEQPSGSDNGSDQDTTWLKANTGVSPQTGQPLSDSRYVNPATGTVKHFPQAPGEGENGKPVAGKRVQTTSEPKEKALDSKSPNVPEPAKTAENTPATPPDEPVVPDEEGHDGKLDRNVFQYTDSASMPGQSCAHCRFFDSQASQCKLYEQLNAAFPEKFALNTEVRPSGWCDQWQAAKTQPQQGGSNARPEPSGESRDSPENENAG